MTFSDFESWFETNKQQLPPRLKTTLEKNKGYLHFVCTWKEYERKTEPHLRQLLQQQYPQLVTAHPSFEPHIAQNIEQRMFELMEEMWLILSKTREGLSPAQALPKLYPKISGWKEYWYKPRGLWNVEEKIKEHVYRNWSRERVEADVEKWNAEKWEVFNRQKKLQEDFIETLQTPLLQLLPDLLNMDAAWWDVYVYFMREQYILWKDWNEDFMELVEYNLTAEWLDKPHKERREHIDALYRERRKKKYPDREF